MKLWSQRDPAICNTKLGASHLTIYQDGCLLCDIVNGANEIGGNPKGLTPADIAVNVACFKPTGDLIEDKVCEMLSGIKYDGGENIENDQHILAAIKDPKRFCSIKCDFDKHFVMGWSKVPGVNDFYCFDPYYGRVERVKAVWHNINGARYFSKV